MMFLKKEGVVRSLLIGIPLSSMIVSHIVREDSRNRPAKAHDEVFNRNDITIRDFKLSSFFCDVGGFYQLGVRPDQKEGAQSDLGRIKTKYYARYVDMSGSPHFFTLSIVDIYDDYQNVGFKLKGQTAHRDYEQTLNYYINDQRIEIELIDLRDRYNEEVVSFKRTVCKAIELSDIDMPANQSDR